MAYVFIDDGEPDAAEYDSNYVFFDAADVEQVRSAQLQLRDAIEDRRRNNTRPRVVSRPSLLGAAC